jgi:hypothetical protein
MKRLELNEASTLAALTNDPDPASRRSNFSYNIPRDDGTLLPGELYLANEARFNSAFFSEPLTMYATGWRDPNDLESLLDFLSPPIQVGRRFEFKQTDNSEAFLSELDDGRAIGADFKRVEYKGSTMVEKTHNRGLTMRVDLDTVDQVPGWRETYVARLLQRLLRNELRRTVALLSAAATNVNRTWDTSAGKDPDTDILTELIAASDASGLRPNRLLFGDVAWNKRLLSHRAQATAGGFASASLTPEALAGFLSVDGIRVSRERYQLTSSTKGNITGDIVLLFYGLEGTLLDDPTHAKRFWSATETGGRYRVYEHAANSKFVDLTVEHYSNTVVTSTLGIRKITVL